MKNKKTKFSDIYNKFQISIELYIYINTHTHTHKDKVNNKKLNMKRTTSKCKIIIIF